MATSAGSATDAPPARAARAGRPPDVLFVAHAFPPTFGGVETHLWDLAHELTARGANVACLVGGGPGDERIDGFRVLRRPELSVGHLVRARDGVPASARVPLLERRLRRIAADALAASAPAVVHLHNAHHFAPELAEAFFAAARLPLVNTVHDNVGEHLYPDVLAGPWSGTLFVSRYVRGALPDPAGRARVRHLGIDLARFAPAGPRDERVARLERPVIFHPARLLPWKGVEVGLDAFVRLRARTGAGTLVLCRSRDVVDDRRGVDALHDGLVRRAREAGVAGHVRFLEFDRGRIETAYRAADLVWYPTIDDEPFGLVPLEAMACGRPLVVSDSGGMRETVAHMRTGLVVPKGDAHALADAAFTLLSDDPLRERLVRSARSAVRAFDVPSYVDAVVAFYRELGA